jgi:beta-xylosidase
LVIGLAVCGCHAGQSRYVSKVWVADNGDGTYKNPILCADYSDPDVIRVGDDFYMAASSFNCVPGLPILHSKDLVNWEIIGHAVPRFADKRFDIPQHGNGIWAPSIRYHDGWFWIFVGDPDAGVLMTKAKDPAGPWTPLHLVKEGKGPIDACPLWDDDGNAYPVHAWAKETGTQTLTGFTLTDD